jgi:hypothetical protein
VKPTLRHFAETLVPLAAVQPLSLPASAVAGGQQGAVHQQPLGRRGLGQDGYPLGCDLLDQPAQPGDDARDGRLADVVEGAQQCLREVVAQPDQGHGDGGGKAEGAVASAGWLPRAGQVGDAVTEQVELLWRKAGHRRGVQQSLQWLRADSGMAARSLLAGAVALKLLNYRKSISE